jgi:hypothetical protein
MAVYLAVACATMKKKFWVGGFPPRALHAFPWTPARDELALPPGPGYIK